MSNNVEYDRGLFQENPSVRYVIGLDEAGRGPLAGPLSVGLFVLPRDASFFHGVTDSKKMTEKARKRLFRQLTEDHFHWVHKFVSSDDVDRLNIYEATKRTMSKMVRGLPAEILSAALVITDAVPLELPGMRQMNPAKGDLLSYTVGCSSIIAKVLRDNEMIRLSKIYPEYGFERHKGYGTKEHMEALRKHGPTPVHRRSFGPVKELLTDKRYDLFRSQHIESEES